MLDSLVMFYQSVNLSRKMLLKNLLKEVEQRYLVDKDRPSIDPKDLAKHIKKSSKEKQIVLDSMKDHLIPRIA